MQPHFPKICDLLIHSNLYLTDKRINVFTDHLVFDGCNTLQKSSTFN